MCLYCIWLCGHRAPRHGRARSLLLRRLFLHNAMEMLTASPWQRRFELLAELACYAPLQCLEGNTIWPHANPPPPQKALKWMQSAPLFIIPLPFSQHLKPHSVVVEVGVTCWHRVLQSNRTGRSRFRLILFFFPPRSSVYFDYNYVSSLWFSYKCFVNSASEKGYASLLLSYYSWLSSYHSLKPAAKTALAFLRQKNMSLKKVEAKVLCQLLPPLIYPVMLLCFNAEAS